MGLLSRRQLITIRDFGNHPERIHIGCAGSGKTVSDIIALGEYLKRREPSTTGYAILGKTKNNVTVNMGRELTKWFGSDFKFTSSKKDGIAKEAILFGHPLYFGGFDNTDSLDRIWGASLGGILGDEITTWKEEQYLKVQSRLRGEGLQVFFEGTTNPDSPKHWLKKYINTSDTVEMIKWTEKDVIYDGAEQYFERLKKLYVNYPALYARYVLGEWAASDNMIYYMFNPKVHQINYSVDLKQFKDVYIGIDFGTTNTTAIVAIARAISGHWIVFRSIGLNDNTATEIAVKVASLVDDINNAGARVKAMFIDPSAKTLKLELQRRGFLNVHGAVNDVVEGINTVKTLLGNELLYILTDCQEVLDEFYSYSWKEQSENNPKDAPVKKDDHFMDALRYVVHTVISWEGAR
jgi:PBSX family phage terminase large subunit